MEKEREREKKGKEKTKKKKQNQKQKASARESKKQQLKGNHIKFQFGRHESNWLTLSSFSNPKKASFAGRK